MGELEVQLLSLDFMERVEEVEGKFVNYYMFTVFFFKCSSYTHVFNRIAVYSQTSSFNGTMTAYGGGGQYFGGPGTIFTNNAQSYG